MGLCSCALVRCSQTLTWRFEYEYKNQVYGIKLTFQFISIVTYSVVAPHTTPLYLGIHYLRHLTNEVKGKMSIIIEWRSWDPYTWLGCMHYGVLMLNDSVIHYVKPHGRRGKSVPISWQQSVRCTYHRYRRQLWSGSTCTYRTTELRTLQLNQVQFLVEQLWILLAVLWSRSKLRHCFV